VAAVPGPARGRLDEASIEHVSRFVAGLRAPAENVTVLPGGTSRCSPATVNKHLAALFSFYDYQARNGVALAQSLVAWRRVNRGGYRSFLHHVTAGRPVATRPLRFAPRAPLAAHPDRPAGAHPGGGL
jgi:integrase/recombinase XerD